jgi:hypothetical protein
MNTNQKQLSVSSRSVRSNILPVDVIRRACLPIVVAVLQFGFSGCQTDPSLKDPNIRAVLSMTDQSQLAAIAMDANNKAHYAAITRLTDQHLLAQVAESPLSPNMSRIRAVEKIDDQAVLARVATSDSYSLVRQRAIERLTDQQTLADIAIRESGIVNVSNGSNSGPGYDSPRNLACDAVSRLTNQTLLARVAIETPRKDAKQWVRATSSLTGLGGQMDAIMAGSGSAAIVTADGRVISNEPQWKNIVVSGFAANEAAVAKLTDAALLRKVMTECADPSVRACAERRLSQLSALKKPE